MRNKKGQFIKGNKIGTRALNKWRSQGNHAKGMLGKKVSEETREKMSLSHRGNKSPFWGKHFRGKNHYNWKGGITKQNKLDRFKFSYTVKKEVLKRDNYTCQMCGIIGVELHIDHIQPWAEYIEQRFNINNCRTLCVKCHYKLTWGKDMPENIKTWGRNFKNINIIERQVK